MPIGAQNLPRAKPRVILAPCPADFDLTPLLSREQEAHRFRKMNCLKYRASRLRDQIDPARPRAADLDEIEGLQSEALAVKNRLVETSLLLVVSITKKRVRAGYHLSGRSHHEPKGPVC